MNKKEKLKIKERIKRNNKISSEHMETVLYLFIFNDNNFEYICLKNTLIILCLKTLPETSDLFSELFSKKNLFMFYQILIHYIYITLYFAHNSIGLLKEYIYIYNLSKCSVKIFTEFLFPLKNSYQILHAVIDVIHKI